MLTEFEVRSLSKWLNAFCMQVIEKVNPTLDLLLVFKKLKGMCLAKIKNIRDQLSNIGPYPLMNSLRRYPTECLFFQKEEPFDNHDSVSVLYPPTLGILHPALYPPTWAEQMLSVTPA